MALTYTPQSDLGAPLPNFKLPHVAGEMWSSELASQAKATVVVFMCNHCPYVQAIENRLIQLADDLKKKDVLFVGICSNDPTEYPEDGAEKLFERWKEKKYGFPYLIDLDQDVARRFGAVCTPDFFVFDANQHLAYRGRLDDSWKDETKVQSRELFEAVQDILKGKKPKIQRPSMGCSIKWSKS